MITRISSLLGLLCVLVSGSALAADTCADLGAKATVSVHIRNANPDDAVKGTLSCKGVDVVAESCTAKVPAGGDSAECESAPVDLSDIDREAQCEASVLRGDEDNMDYAVSCGPQGQH